MRSRMAERPGPPQRSAPLPAAGPAGSLPPPASGAWRLWVPVAFAAFVAGCGAPVAKLSPVDAAAKECVSRLELPKTTVTLEEIGETYPRDILPSATSRFDPHYRRIGEADAFEWAYLDEVAAKRAKLLRTTSTEMLDLQRRVKARRKKEEKEEAEAEAKKTKKAKIHATVKSARKGEKAPSEAAE